MAVGCTIGASLSGSRAASVFSARTSVSGSAGPASGSSTNSFSKKKDENITQASTQEGVEFELVASPVQFDEEPTPTKRAPEFNEHGDEILGELGYDWDAIVALKAAGAVT